MRALKFILLFLFSVSVQAQVTTIFSENFSDSTLSGWKITNNTGSNVVWERTKTGPTNWQLYGGPAGGPKFTTSSNGYVMVDSDNNGALGVTEETELISSSINCSNFSVVFLQFEQNFCQFNSKTSVLVSNDSINWKNYDINQTILYNTCTDSKKPDTVDLNITSIAANKPTVWIKFKWKGEFDFWWCIDDIKIYQPGWDNFDIHTIDGGNDFDATLVPSSQSKDMGFKTTIRNKGLKQLTNISVQTIMKNGFNNNVFTDANSIAAINPADTSWSETILKSSIETTGNYTIIHKSSTLDNETDTSNNSFTSYLGINDSVYAKDNGTADSSFGYPASTGSIGTIYKLVNADIITSISIFLTANKNGDECSFSIWEWNGDTTGKIIFVSPTYTLKATAMNKWTTYSFPSQKIMPGEYLITINQLTDSSNISIAFDANQNGYFYDTPGWYKRDEFGYLLLRPNFGKTNTCGLVLNSVLKNIKCSGDSTGQISLTITGGGTSPYQFNWSNGMTTQNINNLSAGNYSIIVTDTLGCMENASFKISEPSPVVTLFSYSDESCGKADGSITTSVSGGSGNYQYSWSNNSTSNNLTAISAGMYILTVTDDSGCLSINPQTISSISAPELIVSKTDSRCKGSCDGSLTISAIGGFPSYSFSVNGTPSSSNNSALCSGNYIITVTDLKSCINSKNIVINEPLPITGSFIINEASCTGNNDANIIITPAGGTPGYVFNWNVSTTDSIVKNIFAGTYTVTIIDSKGCDTIISINIKEPQSIVSVLDSKNVSCYKGSDGQVFAKISGGKQPYKYNWNDSYKQQGELATGLIAGNYLLTVYDNNNCIHLDSTIILEPTELIISTSTSNSNCGLADGSAKVSVSGGTKNYFYFWSTGDTVQIISNLSSGSYTITVIDNNSCIKNTFALVNDIGGPEIFITDSGSVSCFGGNDGFINVSASGGTLPYKYIWKNSKGDSISNDSILKNINFDEYAIIISDNQNCKSIMKIYIEEPSPLTVVINKENNSCYGFNDGYISASVSGGKNPYLYFWSDGSNTESILGLKSDVYSVTIIDTNGCNVSIDTIEVLQPETITIFIVSKDASCGNADGSATASATGGNGSYNYLWSTGSTINSIQLVNIGFYLITVTDLKGCVKTDSVIISNLNAPSVILSATDISCYNKNDGSIIAFPSGGTAPYIYNWSNGSTSNEITGLTKGSYQLDLIDSINCTVSQSVIINEPNQISLKLYPSPVLCFGENSGSIATSVSGGTGLFNYSWSNGSINKLLQNILAGVFTLTIRDENNCKQIDSVTVEEPDSISIPLIQIEPSLADSGTGSIFCIIEGGTLPLKLKWSTTDTSTKINNLLQGTYTLTITDANGCVLTKDFFVGVIIDGIGSYYLENAIQVYPNPTSGIFTLVIELNKITETKIILTNILGQVIYSTCFTGKTFKEELNLTNFSKGIYSLKLVTNDVSISKKVVYR